MLLELPEGDKTPERAGRLQIEQVRRKHRFAALRKGVQDGGRPRPIDQELHDNGGVKDDPRASRISRIICAALTFKGVGFLR
jgi:hypothetical protein